MIQNQSRFLNQVEKIEMITPGELLRTAVDRRKIFLVEDEAKAVLEAAGIATVRCYRVYNAGEARKVATDIGFPVALKVCSPVIRHKSAVGGVALNLMSEGELVEAYARLITIGRRYDPRAVLAVEKMAPPGRELVIGVTAEKQFGAVIMLGLGRTIAEFLEDATYRLLPLEREDAWEMIASLRGYPALVGCEGGEAVDVGAVQEVLVRISTLVTENSSIRELDLSLLAAYTQGAVVLDAQMVLGHSTARLAAGAGEKAKPFS